MIREDSVQPPPLSVAFSRTDGHDFGHVTVQGLGAGRCAGAWALSRSDGHDFGHVTVRGLGHAPVEVARPVKEGLYGVVFDLGYVAQAEMHRAVPVHRPLPVQR